jgi:hypothetical protein
MSDSPATVAFPAVNAMAFIDRNFVLRIKKTTTLATLFSPLTSTRYWLGHTTSHSAYRTSFANNRPDEDDLSLMSHFTV